ncbi:unnamed protein product [Calypogeia fissa]
MVNSEDYDHLLKEKSSWMATRKQLEEKLREAKEATERVVQERKAAHATASQHATTIDGHLKTLGRMEEELSRLCINEDQLQNDNIFLTNEVQRLTAEVKDLDGLLDEAAAERGEALQDAENVGNLKDGLLNRIAALEEKFLTPADPAPDANGKRQRVD